VVDDPGDLLWKQPGIDRMADRADPHDAVPAFEVARGIPGDGGDAVAELDPGLVQRLRDLQRTFMNLFVGGADDGSFDRSRDDLLVAVNCRRMFENAVAEQGPVLHQTKHTDAPPSVFRTSVSVTAVSVPAFSVPVFPVTCWCFPCVKELP
jgi:hypothetical protein